MADINKYAQFLRGYLEEQERSKTEKKLQTLMKDKDYDVSWTVNPVTGQRVAQVKKHQQLPAFVTGGGQPSLGGQQQGGQQVGQPQQTPWVPTQFSQGGVTYTNPDQAAALKQQQVTATKTAEQNVKRDTLAQDLESFFAVDDIIQKNRGTGTGRFPSGIEMSVAGIKQDSLVGRATAMHDAARKRLRVQLVRAAGDVGNLNIVEQKAAEQMIPTIWDDEGTAQLKRAYIRQLSKGIDSGNSNLVKDTINNFMGQPIYQNSATQVPEVGSTFQGSKVTNVKRIK